MADRAAEVAYIEGVRALTEQQTAVDSARARVGTMFSVATIGTGFLAPAALDGHKGMPWLGWVAIGLLLGALVFAVAVLWPYTWKWTNSPGELAGDEWKDRDVDEVNRYLAGHLEGHLAKNDKKLKRIWRCVEGAIVLSTLSVVAWVLMIGGVWS